MATKVTKKVTKKEIREYLRDNLHNNALWFEMWLREHRVLTRYIHNTVNQITHDMTYDAIITRANSYSIKPYQYLVKRIITETQSTRNMWYILSVSFLYVNTPEGIKFWNNLTKYERDAT